MTDDQLSALIKAETELMLQRCFAAGAEYDKAFWELGSLTMMRGMAITSPREKAKVAPLTDQLQRAYDCQFADDKAGHRAAFLAWLEAKHGVRLSDTVLVYGWSVPRETLLDDFAIDFRKTRASPMASCGSPALRAMPSNGRGAQA